MDNYQELIERGKRYVANKGDNPLVPIISELTCAVEALQARVSELEARVKEIVNIQGNRIDDVRKLCDVLGVEPDPTSSPAYNFERCLLKAGRLRNAS